MSVFSNPFISFPKHKPKVTKMRLILASVDNFPFKMKVFIFPTLLFAAVVLRVQSQEKTCKQVMGEMMKYQMQTVSKCTKQLGYKGKEKTEKVNCIMKCVLTASGAIAPNGGVEMENAMKFVLENIPLDVLEKALKGAMKCQQFMEALDPADPTCKTYEPLVKCLTGFIVTICN